jgi:calnexin
MLSFLNILFSLFRFFSIWFSSLQPTKIRAPFLEQFTEDWDLRWKASGAVKEKPKDAKHDENANLDDLYRYRGQWAVEAPSRYGIKDDKGLVAKTAAAHHAISAGFARVVDPDSKDLVIQ